MTTGTELILYDADMDIEAATLEHQVRMLSDEATRLENEYEEVQHKAEVLTSKFDQDPEIAKKLIEVYRLTRELGEMAGVPEDHLPKIPTEEDLKPSDGKPKHFEKPLPAAKQSDPRLAEMKRKCRKLFLKLSLLTHPDKVSDEHLNELFSVVKDAYDRLDLQLLRTIRVEIRKYKRVAKSNKVRKSILRESKFQLEMRLNTAKLAMYNLQGQVSYQVLKLVNEGREDEARGMYMGFLEGKADVLRMQKASLRTGMQLRKDGAIFHQSYDPPTTSTTGSTFGL